MKKPRKYKRFHDPRGCFGQSKEQKQRSNAARLFKEVEERQRSAACPRYDFPPASGLPGTRASLEHVRNMAVMLSSDGHPPTSATYEAD